MGGGLAIEAYAVPGKVALYLEDASDGSAREGDSIGLEVSERERAAPSITFQAALPWMRVWRIGCAVRVWSSSTARFTLTRR